MNKIATHIESLNNLKGRKLFVACSGGLDSMVLLRVLADQFPVTALHVNYGLRGKDSDDDESFVHVYCAENGIPILVKRAHFNSDKDSGINIQLEARKIRYDWFEELISKEENAAVCLAHHADDQVETFFMNLIRKSGVTGLSVMPVEHHHIIRPLLPFTKEELKSFAIEKDITWREDASNKEVKYVRNSWRNVYLPLLEKELPGIREEVLLLVHYFQELQLQLEKEVAGIIRVVRSTAFMENSDYEQLSELAKVEFWRELGQHASIRKEVDKLKLKGTYLSLSENDNGFEWLIREAEGYSFIGRGSTLPVPDLLIEEVDQLPEYFNLESVFLDQDKIVGKLKLRHWKKGDRISPVGMKGSKLVSDIISDSKIRYARKLNTLVLCDDQDIHWVVGLKIGRKAIADPTNQKIIRVTINPLTTQG